MVSRALSICLRGLQFLWSLLVMALVGNMIATSVAGNPSIVNYDMFVAVFGMLSLFFLFPATWNEMWSFHPMIVIGLDTLNLIFWLCGAIATAAYLGVHSCSNESYVKSNLVTNGSVDMSKRCREAQASTAFLWFGFAAFAATTVLSTLDKRHSGINMRTGGIRRGPAMSQV